MIIPPSVVPRAAYVENAAEIKKVVDIPVIAVGRINDVEIAESVLQADKADLVTVARASLADPDMPKKVLEGREDEVIRCIGCLQGCSGENGKGNCVRCLVNPLTGMEDEYDITPVDEAKKVVVVGGGVSGCEAAVSAAMKGHKVTLIEQSNRLGGQWIPAAVPIGKGEFTSLIIWQKQMLDKLGVNVLLNTKADKEMIESYQPDTVIIATGSKPFVPPIKGTDQDFVTNAHEVIAEKDGKQLKINQVDMVIVAVGVRTDRNLLDQIEDMDCKVIHVGDANGVKNGYLGIREGYEAGLNA